MHAGTRRREEPATTERWRQVGPQRLSGTKAQREQRWRSLEERGEVERGEVERGREKQLLAQLCHGASIPTDLSQLISELWFRAALQSVACGWKGVFSPMAFPFCGFSGEYKMRVVWGSWLCSAGRAGNGARSCCQHREECASLQVWIGYAG